MRVCRFEQNGEELLGFFRDSHVISLPSAAKAYHHATHEKLDLGKANNLLDLLPPQGALAVEAAKLATFIDRNWADGLHREGLPVEEVRLLVPTPRPNKLFLLAGNYAKHIEEGGGIAAERRETFPYVFMKPPTTTLTNPGDPILIPRISPDHIDWELELAVIIGQRAKHVSEETALSVVAGYTVINDISNRRFRPNPERKEREKDSFFDWLHGKWFDSFCPCGPCIASASAIADPQSLKLQLAVNGEIKQDSTTANQIFSVAAVIEFISSFVTLEPGDIISTGTPAGVGNTTNTYLRQGDAVEATIDQIGTIRSPVEVEK